MNRQHLNQNFVPNAFDMEIVDNTQFQADRGQQLGSTPKERLRQNTGASFAASINYDLARAEPFKGNTVMILFIQIYLSKSSDRACYFPLPRSAVQRGI